MEPLFERAGGPLGVAFPEARIEAAGNTRMRGYAIVFNVRSQNLGGFIEIIDPQAMERTFKEAIDVMAFVNHDTGQPLAALHNNTLEIGKDKRGLSVMIDVDPEVTYAGDILRTVRRGTVNKMSFGFRTLEDDWDYSVDPPVRTVLDMRVSEVSIVSRPAYDQTDVQAAIRSQEEFLSSTKDFLRPGRGMSVKMAQMLHRQRLAG